MKKISPGLKIVILLLLLVIGSSILLTNGIFPPQFNSYPQNTDVENVPVSPSSSSSPRSLQLKPIQFTQKQCGQTLAVDFLVDNSGSMSFGNKLTELKQGMIQFSQGFTDTTAIAVQKFSDKPSEVIPFSYYKDVRTQYSNYINSMSANGATYTKDAFVFTKQKMDAGISKFPNYKFALIFISDGVPETVQSDHECIPAYCRANCQCFAPEQDPTDVASQIKQEGIRIFTIAYVDKSDTNLEQRLENLMSNVASSPDDFYKAPDSNQISGILSQISQKLCQ